VIRQTLKVYSVISGPGILEGVLRKTRDLFVITRKSRGFGESFQGLFEKGAPYL
jgi:hypothetical protein